MRQLFPPPESPESPPGVPGPGSPLRRTAWTPAGAPSSTPIPRLARSLRRPRLSALGPREHGLQRGRRSVGQRLLGGLSGYADHRIFGILRSLADVILVGAGTAADEHYRPAQQARSSPACGRGAPRRRRSRSSRGASTWTRGRSCSRGAAGRPDDRPHQRAGPGAAASQSRHADVIVAGTDGVDLRWRHRPRRARLRARAHRGRPHLLAEPATGGLLDELCLTVSRCWPARDPAGSWRATRSFRRPAGHVGHVLEDEGFLLCRTR